MKNLVTNQHGIFTYRKSVNNSSLRISLQTKDNLEALRIVDKLNSLIEFVSSSDPDQIRRIVYAVLIGIQPTFQKERIGRVQDILGIKFESDTGEPISVIIRHFIDEKLRTNAWNEKTFVTYKVIFENLVTFLNDKSIKAVIYQDAQTIKSQLQRLPSSISKRAMYRGKTLKQVLKMVVPESHLMSVRTINTRLGCYSELFKWAIKNGHADINVFDGLALKDNRNARDLRLPFTPQDLKDIFGSSAIRNFNTPWQYWLPVLALYTGARLNELCQLQFQDIKFEQGIWLLSITNEGENQYLKSVSSKRIIPIHNELIRLGFIEFINTFKTHKARQIFPDLTMRNQRYSHTPSKWFGRVKSQLLADSEKKSFHSFRHTFIDYMFNSLKLQGNPLVKVLIGHTDREVTSGVYGSSFEISDLNEIIQQIDFKIMGVEISYTNNDGLALVCE
jgi:integrase